MESSELLESYRKLAKRLRLADESEAEHLLRLMDAVWWAMSYEEKRKLEEEEMARSKPDSDAGLGRRNCIHGEMIGHRCDACGGAASR